VSVIGGSVSKGRGLVPAEHRHEARQYEDEEGEGQQEQPAPVMVEPPPIEEEDERPPAPEPTSSKPKFGADTLYSPENMHVLVFDWLNETFPHPENRLVNGAQGGVGSGYFSWCFSESPASSTWGIALTSRGAHIRGIGPGAGRAWDQRPDPGGRPGLV